MGVRGGGDSGGPGGGDSGGEGGKRGMTEFIFTFLSSVLSFAPLVPTPRSGRLLKITGNLILMYYLSSFSRISASTFQLLF